MATYAYTHRGAALPYDNGNGVTVLKRHIDLPELLAYPNKIALASAPTVGLSVFTGFAQNDILEVFEVPAGTLIFDVGLRVTTAEGATAAAEIGYNSATQTVLGIAAVATNPNAYFVSGDLNSETVQSETKLQVAGTGVGMLDIYVTEGSIDLKMTTSATYDAAIFDVWAVVMGPLY
jgi:hypothetical protein